MQTALLHSWADHALPVTALACGHMGVEALLVSVGLDSTAKIRSMVGGALLASVALPAPLRSVTLDPWQQALYAGTTDGAVYVVHFTRLAVLGPGTAIFGATHAQQHHVRVLEGCAGNVESLACDGSSLIAGVNSVHAAMTWSHHPHLCA